VADPIHHVMLTLILSAIQARDITQSNPIKWSKARKLLKYLDFKTIICSKFLKNFLFYCSIFLGTQLLI